MRIDQTLYRGRADEGRLDKERRCYDLLDGLGIEFFRVDHEHADTIEASAQIGSSRLSFGGAEDMERLLGVTPGSVSLLGLMNDEAKAVRLLVDRDLLDDESFGCHPCINTSSLRMPMRDVREKLLPALGHEPTYVNLPREIG